MDLRGAVSGGRLTPEDARALVILRHHFGISRVEAAQLPIWEFNLLVGAGEQMNATAGIGATDAHAAVPSLGWTADEHAILMGEEA